MHLYLYNFDVFCFSLSVRFWFSFFFFLFDLQRQHYWRCWNKVLQWTIDKLWYHLLMVWRITLTLPKLKMWKFYIVIKYVWCFWERLFSCIFLFSTASSRSSHRRCSIEIGVVKILTKFTGKHLCQSLFKVTGLRPATLLKMRLWHRCFPVNFVKLRVFYRTPPDDCFYNSYLMHDVWTSVCS